MSWKWSNFEFMFFMHWYSDFSVLMGMSKTKMYNIQITVNTTHCSPSKLNWWHDSWLVYKNYNCMTVACVKIEIIQNKIRCDEHHYVTKTQEVLKCFVSPKISNKWGFMFFVNFRRYFWTFFSAPCNCNFCLHT